MLLHSTTPRLPGITLFSATYCTDFPKCYSVPSCYTKALADYSTETVEYYSKAAKYFSAPIYTTITEAAKDDAVPTCYTKAALSCYVEQKYYTNAPVHYTTTYATHATRPQVLHRRSCLLHDSVCCLVNYTEAPKYYITKALEFYTSICMLILPTTPRPRITTTLKRSSTTLYNLRCPELLHLRPEVLLCVKGV
jgi:hypothetical protein